MAGSTFVGKTNLDEFAMGSSGENSAFGVTCNPHDHTRVAGGSSSGSVAAVASGSALYALGTDTGGSIRGPASYCGVVGVKPTYGRVSRSGAIAMASSLDQIGPITKNVTDAAIVLEAIAGHDPLDSTSSSLEVPHYVDHLSQPIKGMRIAVPKEFFGEGLDPRVAEHVKKAIQLYRDMGAIVEEVSLPMAEYALATYYIIVPAEVSSNLARYDGIRYGLSANTKDGDLLSVYTQSRAEGFGQEVRRRVMLGTYTLSAGYYDAYYLKAQKVRTLISNEFKDIFSQYDIIVAPTTPTIAPKIGEVSDPLAMYLADIYTVPANLSGIPAMSLPCGTIKVDDKEMPVGIQIMARHFDETSMLRAAYALEQALQR
jgi:aspartyl-tRNA(Asn)/glutamyl-tRNA(Gln) amidotransferase subunit A